MRGLIHAERIVQSQGEQWLVHLIKTHEYADADYRFFIGVSNYLTHYRQKIKPTETKTNEQ